MSVLRLEFMINLNYRASFRVQPIDFCDPEPVQYRQEWFGCRRAFYGGLNDMSVYFHSLICSTKPLGASTSSISILGPADTQGRINITISDGFLNATDEEHGSFSAFSKPRLLFANSSHLKLFISRHGAYRLADRRILYGRQLDSCSKHKSWSNHT